MIPYYQSYHNYCRLGCTTGNCHLKTVGGSTGQSVLYFRTLKATRKVQIQRLFIRYFILYWIVHLLSYKVWNPKSNPVINLKMAAITVTSLRRNVYLELGDTLPRFGGNTISACGLTEPNSLHELANFGLTWMLPLL